MSGYLLQHDLDEDPTLNAGYVLDEPLQFEDGEAVVNDEESARELARRHTHIEYAGPVQEPADEEGAEDVPGDDGAVDAEAFVDRTPMDDVVDDIESGEYDEHLDEIEEAEKNGKDRDGVTDAIESAREE